MTMNSFFNSIIKYQQQNNWLQIVELSYGDLDWFLSNLSSKYQNLYFQNLGYSSWQKVLINSSDQLCLNETGISLPDLEPLNYFFQEGVVPGVYVMDGQLDWDILDNYGMAKRQCLINNCALKVGSDILIILLTTWVGKAKRITLRIPVVEIGLPTRKEIVDLLPEAKGKDLQFVASCSGLSRGEILNLAHQNIERLLAYKQTKLNSLPVPLDYFSDLKIGKMGGNDLLQEFLFNKVIKLNEPAAEKRSLRPPKGMLLIGPPGTGKTLTAKMTAQVLGYSLLGLSFGNVLSSENPDRVLTEILALADAMDKVVLLLDDFDKGFSGWESGGAPRRLSQKLLTWMQEHTSKVFVIATVNRVQFLPIEIVRRFNDGGVWLVDLPHRGALKQIFEVYLKKYCPVQFRKDPWDRNQWFSLLA